MHIFKVIVRPAAVIAALMLTPGLAAAQVPPPPQDPSHQHDPAAPAQEHVHAATGEALFDAREASGTSWLPDVTPMYGVHAQAGSWGLMFHGNGFAQSLYESGDRGSDQFGSINWFMAMARRGLAGGRLGLRGMVSLEAWSIGGCGYPDLLATGELCDGETIHDRQHPHDLFMELAAEYDRPLFGTVRWQLYGGVAAEPALGPVAFPHRTSAMPQPLAPMTHHWLDATHVTFGVVTAGIYGSRWKIEGSSFNGREPDEDRTDLDLAALDSYSGRLWLAPTPGLALQVSAGHLAEAEPAHEGEGRVDVDRITASATFHRTLAANTTWASTVAWGRNLEEGEATHAILLETNLTLHERDAWFGRFEWARKSAHDLDIHESDETFGLAKLQAGYTRYLSAWRGLQPGIGAGLSIGFVPAALEPAYGRRANPGVSLFFTLRPAVHQM